MLYSARGCHRGPTQRAPPWEAAPALSATGLLGRRRREATEELRGCTGGNRRRRAVWTAVQGELPERRQEARAPMAR